MRDTLNLHGFARVHRMRDARDDELDDFDFGYRFLLTIVRS